MLANVGSSQASSLFSNTTSAASESSSSTNSSSAADVIDTQPVEGNPKAKIEKMNGIIEEYSSEFATETEKQAVAKAQMIKKAAKVELKAMGVEVPKSSADKIDVLDIQV